ncbi:hypothetical protein HL653_07530 [Sphingomonas sp. AP4-R1]|uniref:hypothetical protein n=1 Tax=Sphingomonas sp. AP4-R1 TaxID=2735134 RepID=UPI00149355FE|nr:hypothetical protein [Sphingomonas sp. AP4-R1]QJU57660.1 hypothetical protein HL653_07530 [Sphingomonas sp. AP4-R1]
MPDHSHDDYAKELRSLLDRIQAHPEQDWTQERARIVVLNELISGRKAAAVN